MKQLSLLTLLITHLVFNSFSQTFITYNFNKTGVIKIPSNFKNAESSPGGDKTVVVKANGNIDGHNFYVKFSYEQLDRKYSQNELRNSKDMFFSVLTEDFNKTKRSMPSIGSVLVNSFPNEFIEIDNAIGGKYSYNYKVPRLGNEIRTTTIYQLYYQDKKYYLTFGWSSEVNEKSIELAKKIINNIRF